MNDPGPSGRTPGDVERTQGSPPIPFSRPGQVLTALLLAASIVAFASLAVAYWNYTVDDAFITFRYAGNLVRGWGLTFNHAPPRAEGYTSLLWTLLMAIPEALGRDPVLFAKLTGLILSLGTVGLVCGGVLAASRGIPGWSRFAGAAFAATLLLSFSSAAVHAVSGMETALAAFLYTGTAVLFLRTIERGRATALLPLACLGLGLTRPEANLFCAVLLGLAFLALPATERRRFGAGCLALYVLPGAAYFALRASWYGALMPLPFYIKSDRSGLAGLDLTVRFLRVGAVGFALPIGVLVASRARRSALLLVPVAALIAYFLTVDHIMGYGHRYFFPLVPVLALLAGHGVSAGLRAGMPRALEVALLLGLALAFGLDTRKSIQVVGSYQAYGRGMAAAHIPLGRALAATRWSAPPTIAVGDAGAIPYYSRLETIDTFGLNEPAIALRHGRNRVDYVLGRRPTLAVLISQSEDVFDSPLAHEDELWPALVAAGYDRHVTLVFGANYFLWVLWKSGDPDAAVVADVLGETSRRNHALRP